MICRNKSIVTLFLFYALVTAFCQVSGQMIPRQSETEKLRNIINYLASEELAGRKSGEPGDSLAAVYIAEHFRNSGLTMLYDNGVQYFSLITSVETGIDNALSFHALHLEVHTDFLPYSFSANKEVVAPVVFAGYGFTIHDESIRWNDYAGVDVSGKWVLLLKGDPDIENQESVFAAYAEERAKVLNAVDHGAAGVLLVGGPKFTEKDELQGIFYDKNSSTFSIPVLQITRSAGDKLLSSTNNTVELLENRLNEMLGPQSFNTDVVLTGRADIIQKKATTHNVVAVLEGFDPVLKEEYIVIGAHYDHLGVGGPGSGSRVPDTPAVHFGADDNASGVAAMLELAGRAARDGNFSRSLIFVAFGAEEMGLIGATTFTANPPVSMQQVKAMFNFDMVGRLDETNRFLNIGGTQTSLETEEILSRLNSGFSLNFSPEGSGPSDHAAFYMQNIPVFFISTGAHSDYHTPFDTPEKINYTGILEITDYFSLVITEVSNQNDALTFRESGSMARRSSRGRLKVTLGVMPDFAGQEKSGLRIDAVTTGKPASAAGMIKGDIITAINGNPVGNIYDYMNRLNTLQEGQTISIDILRGGNGMVLIVQL